ncbi:helix-turn-helix domain-containing protein [Glutamicibacter protophormiae]|uniref:helix-turn-helix domain-containing protein n=1 Tax=Glutamicibacter protophormiae TaxID=37930 RepID=UPI003BB1627D
MNSQDVDSRRWNELLDQLDTLELTDKFLKRLESIPIYAESPLPNSEIRRTGQASFEALILAMRTDDDDPGYLRERDAIALEVGVSRARAQVPVEALMTAIRLDFSIIWQAIAEIAKPEDAQLIVQRTARVWEVVDGYAGATESIYVEELARVQAETAGLRQSHLATLFSGRNLTPAALEGISVVLGHRPDTEFVVAVALWEHIPSLRLILANFHEATGVVTFATADALVVFYPLDASPGSNFQKLTVRLGNLNCGLLAEGCTLEHVPHSADVATILAELLVDGEQGAMTWARGWARMARREMSKVGAPGIEEVDRALSTCAAAEQRRLREAVQSYMRTGSIARSADELYCHRNTLMNRLKRFAQLTGVDPTIPVQAARLVVGWS